MCTTALYACMLACFEASGADFTLSALSLCATLVPFTGDKATQQLPRETLCIAYR